jgi:N-acetylglucosaminyldiphosphoundecaprenol N-acetyl-beta-D-mannosaminyltransferase
VKLERESILGVEISALNMDLALECLEGWIGGNKGRYVCVVPAHSLMDAVDDPEFRVLLNTSDLATPDGMPLVWILRSRGYDYVERVYGPDLMMTVFDRFQGKGCKHFFYGGEPGVADELAVKMKARFRDLQIVGTYSPPFRALTEEEQAQVIEKIRETQADIVWVGISSPKQEFWMASHKDLLDAVLIGVGAAFDFLSGHKRQAPRWIQKIGLEWLFRWLQEPRRLWPRYSQYPRFVWLVLKERLLGHSIG